MDRNNSLNTTRNVIIFRKFIPITIVIILTLIQGILGIGCLVIVYLSYDCNPSSINLGIILFFKYFGGDKCDSTKSYSLTSPALLSVTPTPTSVSGEENVSQYVGSSVPTTFNTITIEDFNKHLPDVISVAKRMQIELILYGVISLLWIITSLFTLVSCLCKYVGKTPFCVCFVPWFTVVIAGCILDLVAMIFHIRDITNTRTLERTLEYLEIQDTAPLLNVGNYSKDYLYLPIIVTCITSKLFILWIINLCGSFLVIRQSKMIVYNKKLRPSMVEFQLKRENGFENTGVSRKSNEMKEKSSCGVQTDESESNRQSYEGTKISISGPYDIQSINLTRLDSTISNQTQEVVLGPREQKSQIQNNRDTDSLSRFSLSSSVSRVQSIKEKLHLTDELRSQLPWSYLNARNDIGTSIRVLAHHEHKDVLPPVPVPDYESNFQRQEERPPSQGSRVAHRLSGLHFN